MTLEPLFELINIGLLDDSTTSFENSGYLKSFAFRREAPAISHFDWALLASRTRCRDQSAAFPDNFRRKIEAADGIGTRFAIGPPTILRLLFA